MSGTEGGASGTELAPTPRVTPERQGEYEALVALLDGYAAPLEGAREMARRIARSCLGERHLWRDMALPDRAELRRIFETYFPELAAGNDRDMRWKRYLYKRLCGWAGFST